MIRGNALRVPEFSKICWFSFDCKVKSLLIRNLEFISLADDWMVLSETFILNRFSYGI